MLGWVGILSDDITSVYQMEGRELPRDFLTWFIGADHFYIRSHILLLRFELQVFEKVNRNCGALLSRCLSDFFFNKGYVIKEKNDFATHALGFACPICLEPRQSME